MLDEYGAVNLFPRLRIKELLGERERERERALILGLAWYWSWRLERRSGVSHMINKPVVCKQKAGKDEGGNDRNVLYV